VSRLPPQRVAVVGAGIMGSGIAQVSAAAGHSVVLFDLDQDILGRALGAIEISLERLVRAGKLDPQQAQDARGQITPSTSFERTVAEVDLVIEAVTERLDLKLDVFAKLQAAAPRDAVLASNTSQFSITQLAGQVSDAGRVVGLHFFNPPAVMRLVEVVRAMRTSDETLAFAVEFTRSVGKESVVCLDAQGFITSRIIMATMLEALRILDEGVATKEDIDKACRLGFNWPMGPIELMDFTGLDTALSVAEAMAGAYGERFLPTQRLRNHVRAGFLGRKSGRGFYAVD
jgi:3-hydroxybutyryl-CoA dehydrogenase